MEKLTKPQGLTAAKKLARLLLLPRALLIRPATRGKRRGRRGGCDEQVFVFRPAEDAEEPASPRVSCVGRVGGGQYWKAAGIREGAAADKGRYRLKLQGHGAVEPVEGNSPGGFEGKEEHDGACMVEWVDGAAAGGGDAGVGAVVLEERPEVNLWKRRAVKPPMPLRV